VTGALYARVRFLRCSWLSAAVMGLVIVGCSPTAATIGPQGSAGPSGLAPPASETAAAASGATPEASPVAAPLVLVVTCDGMHADIPMPLVRTQADGIHVHVANTSGRTLDVQIEDAAGAPLLGDVVPDAGGAFVYTFGPGGYGLTCGTTPTSFAVVDPDRFFRPFELLCADQTSSAVDHAQGARGPRGSLLDIARADLRGLEPIDLIEHAGYPRAGGDQLIRVVRAGQVVAVLQYADDGHGGWLLGGTRTCSGSGVTAVGK
jgi:hypothetical protein